MKSPVLSVFLTVIAFCTATFGQNAVAMKFDLTPSSKGVTDTGRNRIAPEGGSVRSPESAAAAQLERRVFDMLNTERRSQGLTELAWNDNVAAVARLHSQNMAEAKFFGHRGSDGSMVDDRADRLGLGEWRTIGENIAYMRGYDDPASLAVAKWMESTAHRNNLLGTSWKESAVGVSITADGTYYLTQVFLLRK